MRRLSSPLALLISLIVFLGTLLITYFFPEYSITTGGVLITIFLTVFMPGRRATLIYGVLGIGAILWATWLSENRIDMADVQLLYRFTYVGFSVFLVLYIKQLYESLQSDKTHMISLFENATEGIILTNSKGIIVLVNPAAERIFQYTADELIGKQVEILIPPQQRKQHVKLREDFHKAPQNRVMGHGRDLHGARKNGLLFPVEVSLSHYTKNNESFAIAFIVDITHRKQIEQNMLQQKKELEKVTSDIRKLNTQLEGKVEERTLILKEALQKLEQSQEELSEALDKERELNEIKSRFVSMASHEFRTPLSTVLSSASLLSRYRGADEQEKRDKHINRIKESVKNLNDILEDFLSLGKLDEGKVNTNFTEFDLKEVVSESAEEMKAIAKQNQQIQYTHEGPALVRTDKKLLRNILINLVGNAIKFSGEGSTISIKSRANGEITELSVTDQGIGISKDDQEHLFSSFFRGKNATNIQGTGLGLHIVKRYLDLIGGNVNLRSELNKGTTVTITVPTNNNKQQ